MWWSAPWPSTMFRFCGYLPQGLRHPGPPGGEFVFSVEHPIFTAYGTRGLVPGWGGDILHWPVDGYFTEGLRHAVFLGQDVVKYHKTLTTYLEQPAQNRVFSHRRGGAGARPHHAGIARHEG